VIAYLHKLHNFAVNFMKGFSFEIKTYKYESDAIVGSSNNFHKIITADFGKCS
jgi:hypothetical protein